MLAGFAALGAYTISADELVHELYQRQRVRQQLERWFGSADRATVAKAVFNSSVARKQVEQFLHPQVWQLALRYLAASPKRWAVFEVPLLFEAGWENRTDLTLLVVADPKTLSVRLKERGLSRAAYEKRRRTQLSDAEKMKRADIVLFNNGSKQALQNKLKRLYEIFQTLYV